MLICSGTRALGASCGVRRPAQQPAQEGAAAAKVVKPSGPARSASGPRAAQLRGSSWASRAGRGSQARRVEQAVPVHTPAPGNGMQPKSQ